MDQQTIAHQVSQAAGILIRLEQDLGKAKGELNSATRNLTIGSVILLIGIIAFIVYVLFGTPYTAALAAVGLLIGGLMTGVALVKTRNARHAINAATDGIADARAELDGLEAQLPVAE